MTSFKRLWRLRSFRWMAILAAALLLLGAGRLSQVAWQSQYHGNRAPYLQMLTPTSVTVRWQAETVSAGEVLFGRSAERLDQSAGGASGRVHEVRLTGLQPNTRYFYAIGAGEPVSFFTPPVAGQTQPTRLWVIGDSGYPGDNQRAVRDAALSWMANHGRGERPLFDMGLALGDNAYNSGTNPEYQAGYFAPYAEILRSFMIWPVYGNHDARRWTYFDVFSLPTSGEAGGVPSGTEHWYAFDHGPVHVVVLDTEASNLDSDGAMLRWLRADLAANRQPWLIAAFHHPPYSKGSHDSDDPGNSGGRMRAVREQVLPVLEAAGVDLVLSGHSHSYERSHLLDCHYGSSDQLAAGMVLERGASFHKSASGLSPHNGTIYAVVGSSSKLSSGRFDHPAMAVSNPLHGSLIVDVDGDRLEARFITTDGAAYDTFTVTKNAGPAFARPGVCKSGARVENRVTNGR